MALTRGNWSVEGSFNGVTTWTCTVAVGATETDSYTQRTPVGLDSTKPWTLIVNSAGTDLDGQALPVDLWVGTSGDADLSGAGALTATDCYNFKQIIADVDPGGGSALINADCIFKIIQEGGNRSLDSKYNEIGGDGTTGIGPDPS